MGKYITSEDSEIINDISIVEGEEVVDSTPVKKITLWEFGDDVPGDSRNSIDLFDLRASNQNSPEDTIVLEYWEQDDGEVWQSSTIEMLDETSTSVNGNTIADNLTEQDKTDIKANPDNFIAISERLLA